MKTFARIVARLTGGFVADPDPTVAPAAVPADSLFRAPDQLPADGVANILTLWLENSPAGQATTVDIWALDDDSAIVANQSITTQIPKPAVGQHWTRIATAVVVTAPVMQVVTDRPFVGVLYIRQTASTLVAAGVLKIGLARL